MKKFLSLFIAAIMFIAMLCVPLRANSVSAAYFEASPVLVSEIKTELTNLLTTTRIVRPAGSDGEKETLEYILTSLSAVSGLEVLDNGYFNAGKQIVEFENSNGFALTTYNVGVSFKSSNPSAKTLSIITNVDNLPMVLYAQNANGETEKLYTYSEAVNESAGSVALMMALAKYLASSSLTFNFNINFIFCGAGGENNAGAFAYKRTISSDIESNQVVLCLNKITVGDYNYFYAQDYSAEYSSFAAQYLSEDFGYKAFNKTTSVTLNGQGNIVHAGIEGAAAVFANTEFNLISLFSGNYNGFASLGKHESQTHTEITHTENDSTSFIELEYKRNVAANLGFVASSILNLVSAPSGETELFKPHNNMPKINFANNSVLALSFTAGAVIIMFVVYYIVYSALLKKSRRQIKGEELNDIIINVKNENDKNEDNIKKE